ncbi:substrate-binding domain-containing protein [Agrococcus sp. Marseille-Q4369]|uniref:substrate-binding domain-containing protein n=1 Tax=Agrococcus sp. Marseille-Q4369 TaxID=2810513 RepID=UPI001B8AA3CC|nr:substrate-binding domain-containing protein [Agrococcus sp. Marseille-Q4369]QUW17840.1 substrate-binding domain-containing protein [Agrococcus sp. Marseille-Q4369]
MITLYSGLVVKQPLLETLIPAFEAYGGTVETVFEPTTVILERVAAGERPDLVLGVAESIRDLADQGVLTHASVEELAVSAVGYARLPESASPADASADAFIEYLRDVAVAYSLSGASGLHLQKVLGDRGVLEKIDERAVRFPAGLTAEAVVDGRADVAIQQMSELRSVTGPHIVEPLPHDLQSYGRFAIGSRPDAPADADRFRRLLQSDAATAAFEAVGLSRP